MRPPKVIFVLTISLMVMLFTGIVLSLSDIDNQYIAEPRMKLETKSEFAPEASVLLASAAKAELSVAPTAADSRVAPETSAREVFAPVVASASNLGAASAHEMSLASASASAAEATGLAAESEAGELGAIFALVAAHAHASGPAAGLQLSAAPDMATKSASATEPASASQPVTAFQPAASFQPAAESQHAARSLFEPMVEPGHDAFKDLSSWFVSAFTGGSLWTGSELTTANPGLELGQAIAKIEQSVTKTGQLEDRLVPQPALEQIFPRVVPFSLEYLGAGVKSALEQDAAKPESESKSTETKSMPDFAQTTVAAITVLEQYLGKPAFEFDQLTSASMIGEMTAKTVPMSAPAPTIEFEQPTAMLVPVFRMGQPKVEDINITSPVIFQQKPFLLEGITFVPLRELADLLDFSLKWDAERSEMVIQSNQRVLIFKRLSERPGQGVFSDQNGVQVLGGVNGAENTDGVQTWPFYIENDAIFLPIRPLAQFFGWDIGWDSAAELFTLTVSIEKGKRHTLQFGLGAPYSRSFWPPPKRIAYLTFDDGPSQAITPLVLDALRQEDVKATFFVVGVQAKANPEILRRAHEEGHAIGNHSFTHQRGRVFADMVQFMDEVYQCEEIIYEIVGERPTIFRMPYGSGFPQWPAYKSILDENGFTHYSWNVNSFDASGQNVPTERIIAEVKQQVSGKNEVIILFHDLNWENTAKALPEIIRFLKEQGYFFRVLE